MTATYRLFAHAFLWCSVLMITTAKADDDGSGGDKPCGQLCSMWRGIGNLNSNFGPADYGIATAPPADGEARPPARTVRKPLDRARPEAAAPKLPPVTSPKAPSRAASATPAASPPPGEASAVPVVHLPPVPVVRLFPAPQPQRMTAPGLNPAGRIPGSAVIVPAWFVTTRFTGLKVVSPADQASEEPRPGPGKPLRFVGNQPN